MAKTKKIISAGNLRIEVIYDRINRRDDERTRTAKRKAQSEAQSRMNAKYSWQKLEQMLAVNFRPGDCVLCLDYENKYLPFTRREADYRLKLFRAAMSAIRKAAGEEFRMVWCTESRHEAGRYHHHVVINSTGCDLEAIRLAWPFGGVFMEPLRADGEKNYETLARYMCKEYPERVGKRTWSYTRSCRHPEVETFTVPDDTKLELPEGAVVLAAERSVNQYGSWEYVKMISEVLPRAPKAKRKHRRRLRT